MNKLTIQINNLEALERLIGGDSEVEIDIRNSVVGAFTKKYLKAIALEEPVKRAGEAIRREIASEIQKAVVDERVKSFGNTGYGFPVVTLQPDYIREIKRHASKSVQDELHAVTKKLIEEVIASLDIRTLVTKTLINSIESEVREEFRKKLA